MILTRLYELALRESLLDDPAFERTPVPYVIKLGADGSYLDIEPRRGAVTIPSRKKGAPPKTKYDKGKDLPAPKAHGNTANKGFARFFVDTLPRVLPVDNDAKSEASRETFWNQVALAAEETSDAALNAVLKFGRQTMIDPALAAALRQRLAALKPAPGDRCTFAWDPDEGLTIVERAAVRDWYRRFFAAISAKRDESSAQGFCQITGEYGPLARSHASKISGVPDGIASGVSLVSYDKSAFESYGLDGAVNAGIGFRAAEGYTRAINALLANKVPSAPQTCLRIANVAFLFWTREAVDDQWWSLLDRPTPADVARLLESPHRGSLSHAAPPNEFYCLCLSGNAARAIVRDYLELPLDRAALHFRRWFEDLRVIDHFSGDIRADFSLWSLATSAVRSSDDLPPGLIPMLARSAMSGAPPPDYVLAACLRRLRVETGASQFSTQRMALVKLMLNRLPSSGDLKMTETLQEASTDLSPGYACGRLLALLARCQSARDYGASAQILERYYGAASTAPRAVFPILLRLNRHHLRKLRDDNPGFAFNLEQELESRLASFRPSADGDPNFPAVLSLAEQGRFALGFYQQRAAYRTATLERKAAEEAGA